MGNRGAKPKGRVKIKWSSDFAYAIGLITTDGCLSGGRYITFVSKDREQIENFHGALGLGEIKIGKNYSGSGKWAWRVQFGDILFFSFLKTIGLMPNKSKILSGITVPREYFKDFVRGLFDGDGSVYSYFDPRWRSSYMFYLSFVSASMEHIVWLRGQLSDCLGVSGYISKSKNSSCYQLKYAKKESIKIFDYMYYDSGVRCLSRKRLKVEKILAILRKSKLEGRSPWT